MLFKDLNLIAPIQKALKTEEYNTPTPIQERAIPSILAGRDLLGCAQTGTGKTAAFAIPILQNLSRERTTPRGTRQISALILAPTRELAIQIGESFDAYGRYLRLRTTVIYGGVSQNPQTEALRAGVDILVATPGRLLDLISQKHINIHNVEMFVLDEADRMLDMGMINDVKKIIAQLPQKRQNMLFSATMPQGVSQLVNSILVDPVRIEVEQNSSTVKSIKQAVYFVDGIDKTALLIHLLKNKDIVSALVFTRTKRRADKVTKALEKEGIKSKAIHGDKSQNLRQAALNGFKNRELRVLVATDVAARGIDVEELSHVINYDLPNIPETYIHRIGRTGRAGLGGVAISFCDNQEKADLRSIEKLTSKSIEIIKNHPYPLLNMVLEQNRDLAKVSHRASTERTGPKPDTRRDGKKAAGKQWPKKAESRGR
ncbi:MAG TPA: DEAD/DEAH box helicase [Patescibacteria group bacterium]|nr:DEAD/DEAH box helicase [Patescibacteria group bacterium]